MPIDKQLLKHPLGVFSKNSVLRPSLASAFYYDCIEADFSILLCAFASNQPRSDDKNSTAPLNIKPAHAKFLGVIKYLSTVYGILL